ncbi:expressed unknown protein [Seminavis robusta]|uniref:Uncharacterized protein n=1 Tax=Seminavis robusta TaxID=568900 RepID=A0A9N8E3N1_9STRA|nr:expressed unknown protein [Seminavis robusta]|eukprot:Sro617_g176090.1 n/a (580) ;mRNA; r:23172-25504
MKYATATAATLLLLTQGAFGLFRDQSTKKDHEQIQRKLEQGMVCELDHTYAQSADTEVRVYVRSYPGDGDGLFDITVRKEPWAPAGGSVTNPGWCIDYDRFISTGYYSMDIFSAFDPELHYHNNNPNKRAVDKRENLPNLAWMINHINVGDYINAYVPGYSSKCRRTIKWQDMQGAIWRIIDNNNGESWLGSSNSNCASEWIKREAMSKGNNYVPDCMDANELVPLVYVVDTDDGGTNNGDITNQVIMSETKLKSIEGMCKCAPPGVPFGSYTGNPQCHSGGSTTPFGYDYGWKMNGCQAGSYTLDTGGEIKGSCAVAAQIILDVECNDDKSATISWSGTGGSVMAIKVKGGFGGTVYPASDMRNGGTFVAGFNNGGQRADISHIEICLNCVGPECYVVEDPPAPDADPTETDRSDFWSSVETAAIGIGQDTLEIRANPDSDEWLWINGNMVKVAEGEWAKASISGFMVRYKQTSSAVREAIIYLEGPKEKISFKTFKSFVRIDVDWKDSQNYGGALGLLGSYDHEGAMFGRDGKTLIKNHHKFGQEWQVEDSEPRLFHSYEGAVVNKNERAHDDEKEA